MDSQQTRMAADGPFEIDEELAGLVPMASEVEQASLTQDLHNNPQREPITLYKGRVVDGRCRQKALVLLGHHILFKELDNELTREEVGIFVKSVNTRRNLTITQKAMSGARDKVKGNKLSSARMAASWAVSESLIKNALFIYAKNESTAEALFNGLSVDIIDANGRETTSTKVSAVYAHLKRLEEAVTTQPKEFAWDANSYIKTQKGKDWFFKQLQNCKTRRETLSDETRLRFAELANFKYTKEE